MKRRYDEIESSDEDSSESEDERLDLKTARDESSEDEDVRQDYSILWELYDKSDRSTAKTWLSIDDYHLPMNIIAAALEAKLIKGVSPWVKALHVKQFADEEANKGRQSTLPVKNHDGKPAAAVPAYEKPLPSQWVNVGHEGVADKLAETFSLFDLDDSGYDS